MLAPCSCLSPDLPAPLMIDLANGTVAGLQLMKVSEKPNGSVDVLPNPVGQSYGMYRVDGPRIVFDVGELAIAVKPKPVLTGNRTPARSSTTTPSYGEKRDIYAAAPALIEQLARRGRRHPRADLLRHLVSVLRRDGAREC